MMMGALFPGFYIWELPTIVGRVGDTSFLLCPRQFLWDITYKRIKVIERCAIKTDEKQPEIICKVLSYTFSTPK